MQVVRFRIREGWRIQDTINEQNWISTKYRILDWRFKKDLFVGEWDFRLSLELILGEPGLEAGHASSDLSPLHFRLPRPSKPEPNQDPCHSDIWALLLRSFLDPLGCATKYLHSRIRIRTNATRICSNVTEAEPRAVEAHKWSHKGFPGAVETHDRALRLTLEPRRLSM